MYLIFHLSLIDSLILRRLSILCVSLSSVLIYPFCLQQTQQDLVQFLGFRDDISLFSLLYMLECVLLLFLSFSQIKCHYMKNTRSFIQWIFTLPPFFILVSIFLLESYFFLQIENISFIQLSILFSIILGGTIFLFSWLAKKFISSWSIRAEWKLFMLLFHILFVIFSPFIWKNQLISVTEISIIIFHFIITLSIIFVFSMTGFFIHYMRENKI